MSANAPARSCPRSFSANTCAGRLVIEDDGCGFEFEGRLSALELDQRRQIYCEAQRLWTDEVPVIPLFQRLVVTVARENMENFRPTPTLTPETWNIWSWFTIDDLVWKHASLYSDMPHDLDFLASIFGSLNRHKHIADLFDPAEENPAELRANTFGLSYVALEGNIGCLVNGAGLAMATMDLVKFYGGEPANFLDIGGSSNPQKVVSALEIITGDARVKSILFNIFGGITRCDDVANGIVQATRAFPLRVPMVIRLTGTNEREAVQILTAAGFSALTDMDEAVRQAVERAV